MSRFIDLKIARVNVDYIVRVEGHDDGSAEVYMIDGTMFRCPRFDWDEFDGKTRIVSLIPCSDLDAQFEDGDKHTRIPVNILALTASGDVFPLMVLQSDYVAAYGEFTGYLQQDY